MSLNSSRACKRGLQMKPTTAPGHQRAHQSGELGWPIQSPHSFLPTLSLCLADPIRRARGGGRLGRAAQRTVTSGGGARTRWQARAAVPRASAAGMCGLTEERASVAVRRSEGEERGLGERPMRRATAAARRSRGAATVPVRGGGPEEQPRRRGALGQFLAAAASRSPVMASSTASLSFRGRPPLYSPSWLPRAGRWRC